MDEESLQTALLVGEDAGVGATSGENDLTREKSHDKTSSTDTGKPDTFDRSDLSCTYKLRRLLHAFRIMSVPYFRESREGKCLFALLVTLILISCGGHVYFSFVIKNLYSAFADKDAGAFAKAFLQFAVALACFVPVDVGHQFINVRLHIAWRKWMTERVLDLYFHNNVYYALERNKCHNMARDEEVDYYAVAADKKAKEVDNPDQRIQEDITSFTAYSLNLFNVIIRSFVDLVSFSIILGTIKPELFAVLILFAFFGTICTILIGKKLVRLNFEGLKREADFRFSLVRIRENAESIAFYSGEAVEEKETNRRLQRRIDNMSLINLVTMKLNFFIVSYNHFTELVPLIVLAPEYFAGIIELGVVQQARIAFGHIHSDLSLVISQFSEISLFSAGIERLFSFLNVIQELDDHRATGTHFLLQDPNRFDDMDPGSLSRSISPKNAIKIKEIELTPTSSLEKQDILCISNLGLATPDNKRVLVQNVSLSLPERSNLLITGVSGAGKSSLLRAIAGLWSTGDGMIARPEKRYISFLPQRPYCPPGTLRDQLLYPSTDIDGDTDIVSDSRASTKHWDDAELLTVLALVDLPELASRAGDGDPIRGLNTVLDWTNTLSLGEQQRLAFARIVTNRPRLVIMDESTSACDVNTEKKMYSLLEEVASRSVDEKLTWVSVGHRPTLLAYHDVKLTIKDGSSFLSEIPPDSGVVDEGFLLG